MFEYLYFWFGFHHFKRVYKADSPLLLPAAIAVCAIQILLVYNAIMIYRMFFPINVAFSKNTTCVLAFASVIVLTLFNYKFYGGKMDVLIKKYESCALNDKLKGWMMFLFMFGLFLLPIPISLLVLNVLK